MKMLTSEALNQNENESQDNEATDVKDLTVLQQRSLGFHRHIKVTVEWIAQSHVP